MYKYIKIYMYKYTKIYMHKYLYIWLYCTLYTLYLIGYSVQLYVILNPQHGASRCEVL